MMLDEYKAVGMGEQLISFKSALPISNHMWQLEWKEYKNGKYTASYKANIDFTVVKGSFKNPEDRMHNPFGLVVKDMVVTQVLGS
jgi:type IV secretory pathway TrbF-like protein